MTLTQWENLRAINCEEGTIFGRVERLLREPGQLRIGWVVFRRPEWYMPLSVCHFADCTLGSDAFIRYARPLWEVPEAMAAAGIAPLVGTPAYTCDGVSLGVVSDAELNADGSLESILLDNGVQVARESVRALGAEALIVNSGLRDEPGPLPNSGFAEKAAPLLQEEGHDVSAKSKEQPPSATTNPQENVLPVTVREPENSATGIRVPLEGEQLHVSVHTSPEVNINEAFRGSMAFLEGRVVTRDVQDTRGKMLARQGETVTPAMIEAAQLAGFLMALAVHTRPVIVES